MLSLSLGQLEGGIKVNTDWERTQGKEGEIKSRRMDETVAARSGMGMKQMRTLEGRQVCVCVCWWWLRETSSYVAAQLYINSVG